MRARLHDNLSLYISICLINEFLVRRFSLSLSLSLKSLPSIASSNDRDNDLNRVNRRFRKALSRIDLSVARVTIFRET